MKKFFKWLSAYYSKMDKILLLLVIVCAATGVVMLYSIAANELDRVVTMRQVYTQILAITLGVLGCCVLSAIDYHKLAKLWFIHLPLTIGITLLTFTSLGVGRTGADDLAWIDLGFITLQPSEFLKISFILSFSYHLFKDKENINKIGHLALLCLHGAIPIALVGLQGDYGTACVFIFTFLVMLFSAGLWLRYIAAGGIIGALACVFAWQFVLKSVHKNRILVLFNPGTDPLGLEYQQNLGLASLGAGGVFGKGLFADSYITVPEMHNDFIFAYVGQTIGFVGAIGLFVVLALTCLRLIANCRTAKDSLGKLICLGMFAVLFSHCFMNIGMVLKVMPVIGVPLPFVSAGGTATLSMFLGIGLAMSTHSHSEKKYRVFYDAE
ncbi:MAG: hypothetical protein E7501_00690 [Ruminococcus sp.]|nr:hypothetical protein [Ruminococcus sp.]MBQ8905545.1 FtsW/RodA/SpoVE family cell cycle protein [Ruminococcus sp.]